MPNIRSKKQNRSKEPKTKPKKKIDSRAKGKAFEAKVAAMFREEFPGCDSWRSAGQCRTGDNEPDVLTPGLTIGGADLWVETKRYKTKNYITKAYDQCVAAITHALSKFGAYNSGLTPVIVSRSDKGAQLVTMEWNDWIVLAKQAKIQTGEPFEEMLQRLGDKAVPEYTHMKSRRAADH